jgi:hypothetical protein
MRPLVAAVGIVLIVVIMWDAFEAMVLPRRVTRRLRPTRFFYRATWGLASTIALRMPFNGGVVLEIGAASEANALATYLLLQLPAWEVSSTGNENWRTSAWERRAAGADTLPHPDVHDHHDF